jgi:hypothetical protein
LAAAPTWRNSSKTGGRTFPETGAAKHPSEISGDRRSPAS